MIAYHADCLESMSVGELKLVKHFESPVFDESVKRLIAEKFTDGLSNLGIINAGIRPLEEPFVIEAIFELVREQAFPDLPSRFQCIFGCKTENDARKWAQLLGFPNAKIRTIEASHMVELDAGWRDEFEPGIRYGQHQIALGLMIHNAHQYWSGQRHLNFSRMELLIPLPARCIEPS